MKISTKTVTIVLLLILFIPELCGCPLCQGGDGIKKETITAYKQVTAFLAGLPVLGGIGLFYWIFKKTKEKSTD